MRKIVDVTGKSLESIQKILDDNPNWMIITSGHTEYAQTHMSQGMRPNIMWTYTPRKYYFLIFEKKHEPFDFKI